MEEEIYENNYEDCDYCETTYYESDTGYCEYGCSFITGDENNYPCMGGELNSGCPFSFKYKVLERLYSFNKPFAVLLPLNSLQGKTRYKYFKDGIQILSFDARICYHNKEHMDSVVKGSPFATAYFCRDLLPKDLIVEKLVTYERPLGE